MSQTGKINLRTLTTDALLSCFETAIVKTAIKQGKEKAEATKARDRYRNELDRRLNGE